MLLSGHSLSGRLLEAAAVPTASLWGHGSSVAYLKPQLHSLSSSSYGKTDVPRLTKGFYPICHLAPRIDNPQPRAPRTPVFFFLVPTFHHLPSPAAVLLFPPSYQITPNLCNSSMHIHAQNTTWLVSMASARVRMCSGTETLVWLPSARFTFLHSSLAAARVSATCLSTFLTRSSLARRSRFYSKSHQHSSQFSIWTAQRKGWGAHSSPGAKLMGSWLPSPGLPLKGWSWGEAESWGGMWGKPPQSEAQLRPEVQGAVSRSSCWLKCPASFPGHSEVGFQEASDKRGFTNLARVWRPTGKKQYYQV